MNPKILEEYVDDFYDDSWGVERDVYLKAFTEVFEGNLAKLVASTISKVEVQDLADKMQEKKDEAEKQ